MFDQIIDLIKNSVTAIVGLVVGILGLGDAALSGSQDIILPAEEIEISEDLLASEAGLSDNTNIFGTQLANISQALQGEPAQLEVATTEYFNRSNVKDAVFARPTSAVQEESSPAIAIVQETQETEALRPLNPIKSNKQTKEVDASLILKIDLDNFDTNLQITEITEDAGNFYIAYQFQTLAIKKNIWKIIIKKKNIALAKAILRGDDLGDYLSEELSEVVDNEIVFLKEVQEIQKVKAEKEALLLRTAQKEEPRQIASVYGALIGKVLDTTTDNFENYTPVKKEAEPEIIIKQATEQPVEKSQVKDEPKITTAGVADNEAPLIIIQGNNPALVQIGSSYLDLGAQVVDNISNNLGVQVGGDVIDSSKPGSYFVIYTATDEAGNTAQATREVIIYDYDVAPGVEQTPKPIIEKIIVEPSPAEIVNEPIAETDEPASVIAEEKIEEETIAITTEIIRDEVATTTALTETATPVIETITDTITKTADTTAEVADIIVSEVVKGGKKAGQKISEKTKEAAEIVGETTKAVTETVSETTEALVETVSETSSAAIEQVSAAVETVTEEVSAMIRKVRFMELLGNIRSALQSSVIIAGEGTGDIFKNIKQFLQPAAVNVYQIINSTANKTRDALTDIWNKIKIGETISHISDRAIANVSNYKKENDPPIKENNFKYPEYQERNFANFMLDKTIEMTTRVIDKTIVAASSLTATVRDFGSIISADLKDAGVEIDQQIENINFSSQGIIQKIGKAVQETVLSAFNFFKTHRPI